MEQLIDFVSDNPLYAVGIAALALLLLFALLRKMVKLAFVCIILIAGYLFFLQGLADDAYNKAERAAQKAGELLDDAGDLID